MEKYSSYKDSGVKWLGEIPSHWEVISLKHLANISSGSTPSSSVEKYWNGNVRWITPADFKTETKYVSCGIRNITEEGVSACSTVVLPQNSVVFSKRAPVGQVSITTEELCVNQGCIACVPNSKVISTFLYYLLSVYRNEFDFFSVGTTFREISLKEFSSFKVSVPSILEQELIVKYLDSATSQIDTAIEQQKKMIDLLNERKQIIINNAVTKGLDPNVKMKDSGVDWIGEICSSWNIFRLKHLLCGNLMYGANESAESEDLSFPRYIRITDIDENGKLKPETFRSLPPTKAEPYLLKKGDILFARSGATSGKTYLFDEDIKACFAGYLIKAQVSNKIISRYLMYYTRSGIYENWKNSIFIQATIQNIGADKYSNLRIPLPSISEQKEIINFLDSEMYKIDKVLDMHKCQISLLQERKQIIINEVVTGKVKVV